VCALGDGLNLLWDAAVFPAQEVDLIYLAPEIIIQD
jgi:hypothetical protein